MNSSVIDSDNWLSLDDIAGYLGVSRDTIRNWMKKNGMPAYKVGHLWRFRKAEVDEWIASGASKLSKTWEKFEKTDLPKFYNDLDTQFNVTNNDLSHASYQSDSNFTLSTKYPRHRWFYYKEGFSPVLVENLLDEFSATKSTIVCDPFCGAGTTLAVAQANGMRSIGFEVNPFAALVSFVKTAHYTPTEISTFREYLAELPKQEVDENAPAPENEYLRRIFSARMLLVQQSIKSYIDRLPDGNAKALMHFCWLCTLEDCSLYRKAGNGLKLKTRKPDFSKVAEHEFAYSALRKRANTVLEDIENPVEGPAPIIHCESATLMGNHIEENSIGIVIFSPPYANCFDYTKIYYLELWFGGFVNTRADQHSIRMKSIRSHVHSTWPERYENFYLSELHDVVIPLIEQEKLWTNRIPSMLNGYFADMAETLTQIYSCLKPGGHCAIVVSNSAYAGVVVPTDLFLAKIAKNLGFIVQEIEVVRLIITSSQQYRKTESVRKFLRESVIKLSKPEVLNENH